MKKIIVLLCITGILFSGCAKAKKESVVQKKDSTPKASSELPQFTLPEEGDEIAVITTNMGVIKVKFFPQFAPKAVENFITHSKNGYYNGVIFHRVVNNFMIQGGDPNGTGIGGNSIWNRPFEDEFSTQLHNFRGALSMANSGPNTNGSQFFIVQKNTMEEEFISYMKGYPKYFPEEVLKKYKDVGGTPHLDFVHTVFGQVIEGMDVVDKIAAVEVDKTDEKYKPLKDVKIKKIVIIKYKK